MQLEQVNAFLADYDAIVKKHGVHLVNYYGDWCITNKDQSLWEKYKSRAAELITENDIDGSECVEVSLR